MYRRFGVQRVLYANQLLEPAALRWLAGELLRDPAFELICLVDSLEAVRRAGGPAGRGVLVEMGHADGRTGCRTESERAVEVAQGAGGGGPGAAGAWSASRARSAATHSTRRWPRSTSSWGRCEAALGEVRGLIDGEAIVSAGGSAYFDRVLAGVRRPRRRRVRAAQRLLRHPGRRLL